MLDKRIEADRKMIKMYERIYSELNSNMDDIRSIRDRINNLRYNTKELNISFLIDDIEYILQSTVYLELSCKYALGVLGNEEKFFFTFTTFYRAIINTISIVFKRLCLVIKENKIKDVDIISINKKIGTSIERELKWRNRMEHGIDPFYCGEHQYILDELSINKIVEFINMVSDLIYMLSNHILKIKHFKRVEVKSDIIPLKNRKIIIHRSNETFKSLSQMIIQLSHIAQVRKLKLEEIKLFDLGLKVKELHSLLVYIYDKSSRIEEKMQVDVESRYKYFMRMTIVIYYQIFDKVGYYLNDKFNIGLEENDRYFKKVITQIRSKELIGESNSIFKDETYQQLNIIRKCLVHNKNTFIDYNNDWQKLNSLIVIDYERVQEVIYNLYKEYFNSEGMHISKRAYDELNRKLKYRKL
ncbi:MAG: Cthe_2314 family HEPN domain-containing protein [Clostridium sp.]|uniref:Cthe_2314 family HEPN domain-containing protein n=1 Tax=Clostridium sp. TaxID=1506 RepID=UPI002909C29C|nr:Cthe_2314 family HEPN domain-containing protein [Clostridium sp.]MDU7150419.1 Cthe_2314 family HEPN domain-containing protein [Clostridium sp.]